jgi:hypothetical protein
MTKLPRALGCSPSLLNKTRAFAGEYTADEVTALAAKGISWGAVYRAFPIKDKGERETWMLRAVNEGWSVHDLQAEMKKARGGQAHPGGRTPRTPRSFGYSVDLQTLKRMAGKWIDYHRTVWAGEGESLLAQLKGLPPAKYSQELLDQIVAAEALLRTVAVGAEQLREALQVRAEEMRRRLRSRRRA